MKTKISYSDIELDRRKEVLTKENFYRAVVLQIARGIGIPHTLLCPAEHGYRYKWKVFLQNVREGREEWMNAFLLQVLIMIVILILSGRILI